MGNLWPRIRLWVYLGITVLCFSAIEVVSNPIRHRIDPFVLTFWRFLLGALFLAPVAFARPGFSAGKIARSDWIRLAALGCLNVIVSMGAHAVCIKFAKASTAAILIASNPLATNLFAWLILGEPLGWRRAATLGVGLTGVVLVVLKPVPGLDTPFGLGAGLLGMTGFALYTVLSKGIVKRLGSLAVATLSFLLAEAVYLPLLLMGGKSILPEAEFWPRLLVLGLVVSGLGYVTFFKALAELPAGRASLLFFLKPPVSVALAWLLLEETLSTSALVGGILIMAGIAIDLTAPSPPSGPEGSRVKTTPEESENPV